MLEWFKMDNPYQFADDCLRDPEEFVSPPLTADDVMAALSWQPPEAPNASPPVEMVPAEELIIDIPAPQEDTLPEPVPSEEVSEDADTIVASIMEQLLEAAEKNTSGNDTAPARPPPTSGPASVLESLRASIPAPLLAAYAEPLAVTPEAAAAAAERSALFHTEHLRQQKIVRAKPDIKAVKKLQESHPDWPVWARQHGHPPGIALGQMFSGRAELWMAGAHQQYFRGIDSAGKAPAYAIVLSGEYEDDEDQGDYLYYTGEGGRAEGGHQQTKDQSFSSNGNAALQRSYEQGVPVRVMRGAKSADGEISYTYDGLYAVTSADLVQGRSGRMVCKYTMVGIPGHYKACRKVTFLSVRGFKSVVLVPGSRPRLRARKSSKASGSASASKRKKAAKRKADDLLDEVPLPPVDRQQMLKDIRRRPGLVCEDISTGTERLPIPVFNETSDGALLPVDFEYITEARPFESTAAAAMAALGLSMMPNCGSWCGVQQAQEYPEYRAKAYNDEGLMMATNAFGVWECCGGEECTGGEECAVNRITSLGVELPLEVFRTDGRGWGVRSAQTVVPGQIVATYEGELITNEEAVSKVKSSNLFFWVLLVGGIN